MFLDRIPASSLQSPPPPCIEEHPAINAICKGLLRGALLGIWMFLPAIKVSSVHKQNRYPASLLAACPVRMSLWVVTSYVSDQG